LTVDLDEARLADRDIIARLLTDYLHELAAYRDRAVGATDRFWASCAKDVTSRPPEITEVEVDDGRRWKLCFSVGQAD
jgi:hypothetical protein